MGTSAFVHNAVGVTGLAEAGARFRAYAWRTTTPAATYTDSALTIPASFPYLANGVGHIRVYYDNTLDYTFVVKSANDANTLLEVEYKDGLTTITYATIDNFDGYQEAIAALADEIQIVANADLDIGIIADNISNLNMLADAIEDGTISSINADLTRFSVYYVGDATMEEALEAAVDYCVDNGFGYVTLDVPTLTITSAVDMHGIGLMGTGTTISNTDDLENVGPVKNCFIRGFPSDVQYTASFPAYPKSSPKVFWQDGANSLAIFTKRPGIGYIRFNHQYNAFASGSSDTGGQQESWRPTRVFHMSEVYLYRHTASFTSGTDWGASTDATIGSTFPGGTVGSGSRALKYRGSNATSAEIAYEVTATRIGQQGKIAFLSTTSSCEAAEIYVNGVLQSTVDTKSPDSTKLLVASYTLTALGVNEVRVKRAATGFLYVFGAAFGRLEDYPDGEHDYTEIAFGRYDHDYISSGGANDYAFFSEDEQVWFGSYHGGETERAEPLLAVDGEFITFPAAQGTLRAGRVITLQSRTNIAPPLGSGYQLNVLFTYASDGLQHFTIGAKGSAHVRYAYTCMSCTEATFSLVEFPKYITVESGSNFLGPYDMVTQLKLARPGIPQRVTTKFTTFPNGGQFGFNSHGGARILTEETRNKLYYGPVINSVTDLGDLSWTIERLFW